MPANDIWDRLAGPDEGFSELTQATKIPRADFELVFMDLAVGGGRIDEAIGKSMMVIQLGTDEEENFDSFLASVLTVTSIDNPAFPLGTAGTRGLVITLGVAILAGMVSERPTAGNPYARGDDLRMRLGALIELGGGTLVGSMGDPSIPIPPPPPPPQVLEMRGAASSAGGAIPEP